MPVQALTDLLSIGGAATVTTTLTAGTAITSNEGGLWSKGPSNAGVYWHTRPDATQYWAWYSYNASRASLWHFNGTSGSVKADFHSDGSITTILGTVAFTGHTHSYLPLSGGILTGLLSLQPASATTALALRRTTDSFDRVQLSESGFNAGDGTAAPDATVLSWSGGTFDVLLAGATKLTIATSAFSAYVPIYSNGTNAALWTKVRTDQAKTWGLYAQLTDGPAYVYFFNGVTGSNLFWFGQDGRFTTTTLTASQATGTAPITVASTTLVTNLNADLWDSAQLNAHTASIRSNSILSGGGLVTLSASSELIWTERMVVLANGRGTHFSTTGFFDIFTPAAGTVITGVGGAPNQTATAAGIPLTDGSLNWVSLYYILPIGSSNLPVPTNFRLVSYSADVEVPDNWVCIARRNPESDCIHLANGLILKPGQSFDLNLYSSANPPSAGGQPLSYFLNTSAAAQTKTGDLTVSRLGSTVATGTSPLVVASTTRVANLNASLFEDLSWVTQLSAGRAAFGGATWDAIDARWEHTEAAGKYAFTIKHTDGQGVSVGNGGSLTLYMGDLASTGAGSPAMTGSVKYFVFDKNGELLTTTLRSTAITGTSPFSIASTTQVTNLNAEMWAGFKAYTSFASLKAAALMTGGGTITFSAAGELRWTQRFVVIAGGRGTHFGTAGYFDITMPSDGTVITGIGGAANQTVVAGGIPLTNGATAWSALYYILPIGSSNTTVNANYRLVGITVDLQIPDTWLLIAARNAETTAVRLGNGLIVKPGQSVSETNTPWTEANDSAGSGLDADLLDGQHGTYFLNTSSGAQAKAGTLQVTGLGIGMAPTNALDVAGTVAISSAIPRQQWNETDAVANGKYWDLAIQDGFWYCRLLNDARTVTVPWLTVSRSGTTASEIRFDCTSLKVGLVEIASQDWVNSTYLRLDGATAMTGPLTVPGLATFNGNAEFYGGVTFENVVTFGDDVNFSFDSLPAGTTGNFLVVDGGLAKEMSVATAKTNLGVPNLPHGPGPTGSSVRYALRVTAAGAMSWKAF